MKRASGAQRRKRARKKRKLANWRQMIREAQAAIQISSKEKEVWMAEFERRMLETEDDKMREYWGRLLKLTREGLSAEAFRE